MNWLFELIPAVIGLGTSIVQARREKLRLQRERLAESKRCKAARASQKEKANHDRRAGRAGGKSD